jgi:TonB family protein
MNRRNRTWSARARVAAYAVVHGGFARLQTARWEYLVPRRLLPVPTLRSEPTIRLAACISALAIAFAMTAGVAASGAAPAATSYTRPWIVAVAPAGDGSVWGVTLRSNATAPQRVVLTLYTEGEAFALEALDVAFPHRIETDGTNSAHFTSDPVFFALPKGSKAADACVVPADSSATPACTYVDHEVPKVALNDDYQRESARVAAETAAELGPESLVHGQDLHVRVDSRVCSKRYTWGAQLVRGVAPAYPALAASLGRTGAVSVVVFIDATGRPYDAAIYHSSGFQDFDSSAIVAAQRSVYEPEIFRCKAVAGSYIFRADFTGP